MSDWKCIDWECCPACSGELEVKTAACIVDGVQYVHDGDEVRCTGYCEAENLRACVEEDGRAWINGEW